MQPKPLKRLFGFLATAAVAFMLVGCNGSQGQTGATGANGATGPTGPGGGPGPTGPAYSIDAATLSPDEWSNTNFAGSVTSASVVGGSTVVNFKITEGHNIPVRGLGFTTKTSTNVYASYGNMAFSIAKLVPGTNGSPSKWVSYIVTSTPSTTVTTWNPSKPSTDNIGTLVDNGDGSYKYTFRRDITQAKALLDAATYTGNNIKADLGDVAFDPTLTHRVTVYVGGNARGTGTNTADGSNSGYVAVPVNYPANFQYDFIPATGAPIGASNERRDITSVDKCFSCHSKFEFHGEGRQDTRYCVVCHTDQRKYGNAEAATTPTGFTGNTYKIANRAVGDFPAFIHRLHMGEELSKTGYNYANVLFNEVTFPQDQRNCVKCHTNSAATPQGNNWFMKPNRAACGACHDDVDWATGNGHVGGQQLDDQNCVNCHNSKGDGAEIKLAHIPIVPPDPKNIWTVGGTNNNTNASYVAAFQDNLPAGASVITYDFKSITLNSSKRPVVTFRLLKDGVPVVFNTYSPTGKTELMDNFVGSPSIYVAFSVPQDGLNNPADFNASFSTYLKNIWRGDGKDMAGNPLAVSAKATFAGPDSSGYYTVTFTDAIIPTTAGMITGGIGYTYGLSTTQPLTQTNVPGFPYTNANSSTLPKNQGGLSVPPPNVAKLISGPLPAGFPLNAGSTTTGPANTPRRTVVKTENCNNCHGHLGVFTDKVYHAGQRNDAQTCNFCHNVEKAASNGWGVNEKDFIHAIHGSGKRVNKFSWQVAAGAKYWEVTYPSVLNNCEICHVPGSYNFEIPANANEVQDLLWTTTAIGTVPNPVNVIITGNETVPGTYWSPFVTAGAVYGKAFAYSANTGVTTPADPTTLVSSPYVGACSNCHDSSIAIAHMRTNGGSFYAARSTVTDPTTGAFIKQEQCFLCHSAGKIADVQKVHMNFK